MASADIKNPPAPTESKSAKKKKAKAVAAASAERNQSPAPAADTPDKQSVSPNDQLQDEAGENAHIRELRKRIRNVNKKLQNASKTDAVIAEHSDKSLEELVTLKIINADQKAQHLGKPELEEKIQSLTAQLAVLKEVEDEHKAQLAALEKSLNSKFDKEKADLEAELKQKAEADSVKSLSDSALIVSQFLRLAAARRSEDIDPTKDENMALEGILLQVYAGDESAAATMVKLVHGVDEPTVSTGQEVLQTTYAQVKEAAIAFSKPIYTSEPAAQSAKNDAADDEPKDLPQTDPTLANAGLTEIDEGSTVPLTNGHISEPSSHSSVPANAEVSDNAANEVGESQWDTSVNNDMTLSQEWVDVKAPRDPAENETGLNATPAAPANTQSWADDQPDPIPEAPAAADPNDGFQSVQRNRGNRDSNSRPRTERGGYRGRGGGGFRGDGRGRGRGRGGSSIRSTPRRAPISSES